MQWTDDRGSAYGEDPYGGAGYAYAYGYEHGGSAPTDTATMPWAPEQVAQETHPTGNAHVAGTDPYATRSNLYVMATDPYAAGPGPATTGWDTPHGDVLTVPPPELDPTGPPAPGPDTPKTESVRPVFVDSSGRRQRRVVRAARLLAIPAGGYVALLISTMLGGPSISAPFVPHADSTHSATPRATAPDSSSGTGHSAAEGTGSTAARKAPGPTNRSTASGTSAAISQPTAAPTPTAAQNPTATSTSATSPTSTAAPAPSPKGRALGASHKPAK